MPPIDGPRASRNDCREIKNGMRRRSVVSVRVCRTSSVKLTISGSLASSQLNAPAMVT